MHSEQPHLPCGDRGKRRLARRVLALLLVLTACAGVRVWLIDHAEVIASDGTVYIQMARQWSHDSAGVIRDFDYHPGYPVTIVGAHRVIEALGIADGRATWELAGRSVSLLAGIAAVAAVWCFAGLTFGWRIAWISALVFGVGRKWAALGADVLSDALMVCLAMWALVVMIVAANGLKRRSPWALAVAAVVGLLAGGSYLVRPEGMVVLALGVGLWGMMAARKRSPWRLSIGAAGVAVGMALVSSLPYMLVIGGFTKKKPTWALATKAGCVVLLAAAAVGLWRLARFARRGPSRRSVVVALVATTMGVLLVGGVLFVWAPNVHGVLESLKIFGAKTAEALHPVVTGLVCVWVIARIAQLVLGPHARPDLLPLPQRECALLILGLQVVFMGVLLGLYQGHGYISYRHVMLCAAALAPLAGAAVVSMARGTVAIAGRSRVGEPAAAFVITVVISALLAGHALSKPLHAGKGGYRQAGEFVAAQSDKGQTVWADESWVFHYSGLTGKTVPASGHLDVETIRASGAQYLVLGGRSLRDFPELATLTKTHGVRAALFSPDIPSDDKDAVHVYRLQPKGP